MTGTAADQDGIPKAASAPRRRRRKRGPALITIAAVGLWLLGAKLGWLGSGDAEQRGDAAGGGRDPSSSVSDVLVAGDSQTQTASPRPKIPGGQQGAPAFEVARDGSLRDRSGSVGEEGVDPDRFESLLSLVRSHVSAGDLGAADGVVARLLPQIAGQQEAEARVRRWVKVIAKERSVVELAVVDSLRAGRILAADRLAERLVAEGRWEPTPLLGASAPLGADWMQAPGLQGLPTPEPVTQGRRVRLWWEGAWVEGRAMRSRKARTTLQIDTATGRLYPTVSTASLEPVGATNAEAVEMALWSLSAGAPRLARLWMFRSLMSGPPIDRRGQAVQGALGAR